MLPPSPFVLDLGCGPGHDGALLTEDGATVIAVDPALGLLREDPTAVTPRAYKLQCLLTETPFMKPAGCSL